MGQISLDKLGYVVEEKRKVKGLTQEELAELVDMNRNTISRIERGSHLPSLQQLNALLKELGVSFEEILEEKDEADLFLAMSGEIKSEAEKKGFDQMISMILRIRKHHRIRGI